MTRRRATRLRLVVALLLLAAIAAGCSSSEEAISGESNFPAPSTNPTVAPPTVTTKVRQACAANTLAPAAATAYEAAALVDVVCEESAASATVTNAPGGEVLAVFTLQDGAWVLVGSGPVDGNVAAVAPPDFSATAIPSWQRLRNARLTRAANPGSGSGSGNTSSAPSSTQVNKATGEVEICTQYGGDFVTCVPPSTAPVTEAPDPDNPDATPAPPVTSNFCRYNYNDTRCVESGQQYQPRN